MRGFLLDVAGLERLVIWLPTTLKIRILNKILMVSIESLVIWEKATRRKGRKLGKKERLGAQLTIKERF